jgi:uncharacterized Ntn-hydrolase superfamily protein
LTVNINVCEHPAPVAELRRIYDTVSATLGFRELQQFSGPDVWQLKVILHALGYYRPAQEQLEEGDDARLYTDEAIAAVDAFRGDHSLSTSRSGSPRGLVDADTVALLWQELDSRGLADRVRRELLELTAIRR